MTAEGAAGGAAGAPEAASSPPPALAVSGVSHAFGRVRALEDVSLSVPQGAFCALLGVNGAGKTTLFSLVTRLYSNPSGRIEVCGHDLRRQPGAALVQMGVVFQARALDPGLTVRENLLYHGALHGLPLAEARARSERLLRRAGLLERADARVAALSGGQMQRVEIARALLHEPRLLLLDEPTAGLDAASRRDVLALVRALVTEKGVGVLWATHLLDEIAPEDRVVVLHRGRVLARGTAAEIAGGGSLGDAFLAFTGTDPGVPVP